MNGLVAVLIFGLFVQACKSAGKPQTTEDSSRDFEEHFTDEHTMLLTGEGTALASFAVQSDEALAFARLDARLNAERKFGDICYGNSLRPCEPRRSIEPRVAEALKKDLRPTREKCMPATAAAPISCRVHFEFRYAGIRRLCENARREDAVKILSAGCGAW